jgi:adenylylsulfate kinase-like enzyme
LYALADKGVINNLIGYSEINPYDEPENANITIHTNNKVPIDKSRNKLLNYMEQFVF